METERPHYPTLSLIAAVAKALATAVLSLALGVAFCLGLLLGGTALAAG